MVSYKALNTQPKGFFAYRGDTRGYFYARKTTATIKGTFANRGNTGGYLDARQTTAARKGIFAYRVNN